MLRQNADLLGRIEDEEHVANIERRPLRTKDIHGRRVTLPSVEQEEAKGRIEFLDQLDHLLELIATIGFGKITPDHLAPSKGFEGLKGAADLDLGFRTATIGESGLRLLKLTLPHAQTLLAELVADHLLRLQQIRQRRRHIADLVAGGLRMPALQASIQRAAGSRFYLQRGLNQFGTSTDRKSTRLNSSHVAISYAVFCL